MSFNMVETVIDVIFLSVFPVTPTALLYTLQGLDDQ